MSGQLEADAIPIAREMATLGYPAESITIPATVSIAISLKRIADALDNSDTGGRPQGTVLWWLEMIASAANAGRS